MDDVRIRELVAALDTNKSTEEEEAWEQLKHLGPRMLPFFLERFPKTRKWQGRVSLVFHSIPYARDHDEAFQLGIFATRDKVALVRYRACMLLAYSLKKEAIPHLKELRRHSDQQTVGDAKAAIDAIKHRNHHYFVDRKHTGRIQWAFGIEDVHGGEASWAIESDGK